MNIGYFLTKASRLNGDLPAIQYGEQRLTYTELNQRVGRLAHTITQLPHLLTPGLLIVLMLGGDNRSPKVECPL